MGKAADKNVIMISIHPEYAKAIFSGEKKAEFRKLNVPRYIEHVVLYVTAPEKKIAGYFSVKSVVEDQASNLWSKFSEISGISKESFFRYYGSDAIGRAILVDQVNILEEPLSLNGVLKSGKPPQSFLYLDKSLWDRLRKRKKSSDLIAKCA